MQTGIEALEWYLQSVEWVVFMDCTLIYSP